MRACCLPPARCNVGRGGDEWDKSRRNWEGVHPVVEDTRSPGARASSGRSEHSPRPTKKRECARGNQLLPGRLRNSFTLRKSQPRIHTINPSSRHLTHRDAVTWCARPFMASGRRPSPTRTASCRAGADAPAHAGGATRRARGAGTRSHAVSSDRFRRTLSWVVEKLFQAIGPVIKARVLT